MLPKTIVHQCEPGTKLAHEFSLVDGEELTYIFLNALPFSEKSETELNFRLNCGSVLRVWNLVFGGAASTLRQTIHFKGEDAISENYTIYFGEGSQNFQMSVNYLHEAPACTSRLYSRGILKDQAFGRYDGMIKIMQTGKKADAFLEEKTLLLSPDAKSEAVPGLEIGTNDVKAAHSASATRVDESHLFYAASRGIPEEEALRIIAEGFLKKLLGRLPHEKTRELSLQLIRDRLTPRHA